MLGLIETIGQAIWFILPAYVANALPVVFGGGVPADFNKRMPDGKRIFGNGKTIRGFFVGLIGGSIFGFIQYFFWGRMGGWEIAVLLSLGALVGDMIGSFVKRRVGLVRGEAMPGLDQLEFVVFALLFGAIMDVPSWRIVVILIVLTPLIHLATNVVGYKMGLKSEPY